MGATEAASLSTYLSIFLFVHGRFQGSSLIGPVAVIAWKEDPFCMRAAGGTTQQHVCAGLVFLHTARAQHRQKTAHVFSKERGLKMVT